MTFICLKIRRAASIQLKSDHTQQLSALQCIISTRWSHRLQAGFSSPRPWYRLNIWTSIQIPGGLTCYLAGNINFNSAAHTKHSFPTFQHSSSALKMEAVYYSETLRTLKSTRRFSTEDQQRHLYRRENLISYVTFVFNAIEFENKTEDAMNVSACDFNQRAHTLLVTPSLYLYSTADINVGKVWNEWNIKPGSHWSEGCNKALPEFRTKQFTPQNTYC
jgi:hypothetical protein